MSSSPIPLTFFDVDPGDLIKLSSRGTFAIKVTSTSAFSIRDDQIKERGIFFVPGSERVEILADRNRIVDVLLNDLKDQDC